MARTISTSLVPIPNASAPNAPWVAVCESPQTIVMPGWVRPELRPDDVDDALARRAEAVERDAELRAVARQLVDLGRGHRIDDRQAARVGRDRVVGGRDGPLGVPDARPRARSPENACGDVTSWTRWRSTARTAGAPGSWLTTWSSQIFSTIVRGRVMA